MSGKTDSEDFSFELTGATNLEDAIKGIRPMPWSDGPNFFTTKVEGWGISAPTSAELTRMLEAWFAEDGADAQDVTP